LKAKRPLGGSRLSKNEYILLISFVASVIHGLLLNGFNVPRGKIKKTRGGGVRLMQSATKILKEMAAANQHYSDITKCCGRAIRRDSVRPNSEEFVKQYCHNDDNSHCIDYNSLKTVKIGKEKHCIRVWENVLSQKEKFDDFKNQLNIPSSRPNILI